MRNIFLVAFREFWQRVRTRGFLLTTLGLPLILLIAIGGSSLLGGGGEAGAAPALMTEAELPAAIGYVDHAGVIVRVPPQFPQDLLVPFPDEASADAALLATKEAGAPTAATIDAYYVIPADYRETGEVHRVSRELPSGQPATGVFDQVLLANLFPDTSAAELARLRAPFQSGELQVVELDAPSTTGGPGNTIMPFLVAMVIMIPLFMSGSYLLYSLTEEKSSRVMEILLVSLRPRDLLAGKLLGLGALTLVQYVVWIALGAVALLVTGQDLSAVTAAVNLSATELLLVLLYGLGGYWLYAGLMAGIGALSPDLESSRTWTFVISLPMLIPIYLWMAITNAPQGTLAVALSLIPFSSPLAMLMRMASATVPTWQLAASLGLLLATAAAIVWLMARLFRVQTLLSGESFSASRFWTALREA
jgi:ABC-2 type transport system permease protein